MKLETYLRLARIERKDFAKTIDASEATISRWINGKSSPPLEMMQAIAKETGNAVQPNDWLPATE